MDICNGKGRTLQKPPNKFKQSVWCNKARNSAMAKKPIKQTMYRCKNTNPI